MEFTAAERDRDNFVQYALKYQRLNAWQRFDMDFTARWMILKRRIATVFTIFCR